MKDRVKSIKNKIMNVPLHGSEIVDILQEEFEDLGVEVTLNEVIDFPDNMATVNGYFNSYDWDLKENIELAFIVSASKDVITINTDSWNFLEHQMRQTLEHEMIHRDQMVKRDGLVVMPAYQDGMSDDQIRIVYLSDPDEMDAYANDVVLDLLQFYTAMETASKLQDYTHITRAESAIMNEYMDLFGTGSDTVRTIVKKALKRVVL
jgi:hypothetical protein